MCVPGAMQGAACVRVFESLRPMCHMCTDLTRCQSLHSGGKEQCGLLFLSERKNELSAPGVWLLGPAGSSWAHILPA